MEHLLWQLLENEISHGVGIKFPGSFLHMLLWSPLIHEGSELQPVFEFHIQIAVFRSVLYI